MVSQFECIQTKYLPKRELVLAIASLAVVFCFSANFTLAAETKISTEQVERIKFVLDIINTASKFGSILVDDGGLMKALNAVISGGQTATNVTYGLLVLSAINEMEFIDLVLSQEYKDIAREYFNKVIDERTNLRSYWKGVGFDIPRIVSGQITGPMGALTLNTFEMTDKIILILSVAKNLQTEIRYDGLWYYFDFRRGGDSHEDAWNFARWHMRWAGSPELEQQFATLYEKWGPHVVPGGVSEEYKRQAKSDLRDTVALAVEKRLEDGPLTIEESKLSAFDKFLIQLMSIKDAVANLITKVSPFSAGPILELTTESVEVEPPAVEVQPPTPTPEIVEIEPPAPEPTPPTPEGVGAPTDSVGAEPTPTPTSEPTPEIVEVEPLAVEVQPPVVPPALCERGSAGVARQYRVLINEVAWMGDQDSPNNEWIELKNVWGITLNLSGWQLQDKDRKIKKIFEEDEVIPAGGYLLLERSKDYTGALNNSNEAVYLFDDNCQLEDEVLANPDWPAGDNQSKKTMQRFDVLSWYSGAVSAGAENSSAPAVLSRPSASAPSPTPVPAKPSYLALLITESQTKSAGNEKDDFVELYNPNEQDVALTDWYMQRKTAGAEDFSSYAPASLFSGKAIGAKSYFVVANASTSLSAELIDATTTYPLTENNTLVLKNPNQEIASQVSTGDVSVGKSYGRQWSSTTLSYADIFESQTSTPRAQNQSSATRTPAVLGVMINEIAWAGTKANSADEWLELFNSTTSDIDLTGWKIKKDDQDWIIFSTSTISAQGYYLLERTDDNAIKDISANQFFTGSLNNEGNKIELVDNNGNIVDMVNASSGWPAGIASPSYVSMERINATSSNWLSNNRITRNGLDFGDNLINGTPKAQNSVSKASTQISSGFTLIEDATMTLLGSPYLVEGSMTVSGAQLTIEAGVTVKFKHIGAANQTSLLKVEDGILEAIGTSSAKIIFTSSSTSPQAGDWDGLYLKNSTSTLSDAVMQYGGKLHQPSSGEFTAFTYGAIYIDGGNAQINNSLIEQSAAYGLWLKNSTSTLISATEFKDNLGSDHNGKSAALLIENSSPTTTNSIFRNNIVGILVENYAAPAIKNSQFIQNATPIQVDNLLADIANNTFTGNSNNGVLARGFGFSDALQGITWKKITAPYFVDAALTIPAGNTLKIDPGVEIKFKTNGQINADGNLQVQGTLTDKVTFTGASEVQGAWKYIKFAASGVDSVLEHAVVKYGGYYDMWGGGRYGAVKIDGFNLIIKNTLFENNRLAVELINAAFASSSNSIAIQNNEVGIYVSAGSSPDISAITFGTGEDANSYNILP